MDRRLGRPLPCQLANPTRVHLIPPEFFTLHHAMLCAYAVLAAISNCYPPVWGRLPTRYSPVRRSVTSKITRRIIRKCFARLACVRHAASVHPEPGSNSQIKVFVQDQNQAWLNFYPVYLLLGCSLRTILFSNCSRICHCSVIKVLCLLSLCFLEATPISYHMSFCLSRTFFKFFEAVFHVTQSALLLYQ